MPEASVSPGTTISLSCTARPMVSLLGGALLSLESRADVVGSAFPIFAVLGRDEGSVDALEAEIVAEHLLQRAERQSQRVIHRQLSIVFLFENFLDFRLALADDARLVLEEDSGRICLIETRVFIVYSRNQQADAEGPQTPGLGAGLLEVADVLDEGNRVDRAVIRDVVLLGPELGALDEHSRVGEDA